MLDLQYLVCKLANTASAVLHRPENGDSNKNYRHIQAVANRLDDFVMAQSDRDLTCVTPKRGVLVEVPVDLLTELQTLPRYLRAMTTEELGRVNLGHVSEYERPLIEAIQELHNPGIFENTHQLRRETLNESTGWQEQIDTIISLARTRPEPIKRLESLADLAAEIIDTAAASLDYGVTDPSKRIDLKARAIKQSIFDECRRKPYAASPKFLWQCETHIGQMRALAESCLERLHNEQDEERVNTSNFHVALERCRQFSETLTGLRNLPYLGPC